LLKIIFNDKILLENSIFNFIFFKYFMPKNKEKYPHEMIKEIYEQPEIIRNILNKYVNIQNGEVEIGEFKRIKTIQNINRITLIGCGSSYYCAMFGSYLFEELTGLPCEHELADEFISRKNVIEYRTAVIAISQSGETTDILNSVIVAKKKGALIISITNNKDSKLARKSDVALCISAGKEAAMAATKTFTSSLVILALLAIFIGRHHKMSASASKFIVQELRLLPDKINKILKTENEIKKLAVKYSDIKTLAVLGKKYNYPVALEGAHKLKETTYIAAEGYASEEFIHGPNAIIKKGFLVIFIAPKDSVYDDNIKIIKELKKEEADIFAVTSKGNKKIKKNSDKIIFIPQAAEFAMPVLSIIPLQLLSYHIAVLKNLDVDRPRNLKKFIEKK